MRNENLPKLIHGHLWWNKIPTKCSVFGNLAQFGQKELVHVDALVSHASNH